MERLDDTSEGPPDLATGAVPAENGRQLITLRDDVCSLCESGFLLCTDLLLFLSCW